MGLFDFFKSHNKEIRSQLEWRECGFFTMFEEVARYIVSQKKRVNKYDIMDNFKDFDCLQDWENHDNPVPTWKGLNLVQVDQIAIALKNAKIIDSVKVNYTDDNDIVLYTRREYFRIIKSHKSLNYLLEDLETLKKNVGTKDEINEQWRLDFNERAKEQGLEQLDKNFQSIETTEPNDTCYLYLMKDYNTGYYKIGISNSPEYREKTLQSEKPTIEMICNKKYVSRRIAHSFEQALHKTFSEKRVRGEWFDLDQIDVKEIELTLNSNSIINED